MVRTQSSENMGSGLRVCRVLTVGNAVTHLWLSLERLVFYHRHIMAERPTVSTCWHQKSDFWNLSLFYVPSKRSHLRCILYQAWYWSVDVSFTVPVTWAFFYRAVSHAVSGDGVNLQKHWTHFELPVVTPGGDPLTLDFFLFFISSKPSWCNLASSFYIATLLFTNRNSLDHNPNVHFFSYKQTQ